MAVRIAVTRAQPQAQETAARLEALGVEAIVAPLLRIEPRDFDADFSGAQALLATSINGVSALAAVAKSIAIPLITVGDVSAAAARAAGFCDVVSAGGDSAALVETATLLLDPKKGRVVHLSGADTVGDVAGALRARGYVCERRVAYEAVQIKSLPAGFIPAPDAVLFHSARAAAAFGALGAPNAELMIAVCISERTAAQARLSSSNGWKDIVVAPFPREDALLHAAIRSRRANA